MDNYYNDFDKEYQQKLDALFLKLPMFSRIGAAAYKPGLERVIRLSEAFGNPHTKFRSIHIAGTNGKGSVANMTAAMLQAAGYKTGLYTSPHLADFRERMRIDGEMIPREKVVEFLDRCENINLADNPSFFELTMMMAFDWFAAEKVDYAIIEVGMGGRLDSTNIITPLLSVITNISFDHTQFLGDTLPKIAGEKAGIIKKGIPVVIGEANGDVERVFREKAEEVSAPLIEAYRSPLLSECIHDSQNGFLCKSPLIGSFRSPLAGDYQKKNINTVLHVLDRLRKLGINITDDQARDGIENVGCYTGFSGRWQVIQESPLTICDTGHNIAGMTYNMGQLKTIMDERRAGCKDAKLRIVIGFVADKDIDHILPLLPRDAVYYVTNADIPRAMKAYELLEKFKAAGLSGASWPSPYDAYRAASQDAINSDATDTSGNPQDVIFIGGSTFIVADFLKKYIIPSEGIEF